MDLDDARDLALRFLALHGLAGWTLRFDSSRRRFGACHHSRQEISLSRHLTLLNGPDQVGDTILHEVAHALAGHRAGHGPRWQALAARIGADPRRTYDSAEVITPPARFVGRCPRCALTVERHRRNRVACARCCRNYNGGRFDEDYLLVWTDVAKVTGRPSPWSRPSDSRPEE